MNNEIDLSNFYGTVNYYPTIFGLLFTDGVKYLADKAKAYWLIDAIGSYQGDPRVEKDEALQEFQFWTLTVNEDKSAVLTLLRDINDPVLTQEIEFTTFPLSNIELYVTNNVILLPGEY